MRIRKLRKNDVLDVQSIALQAWLTAYKGIFSQESIRRKVSVYYSTKSLNAVFPKMKAGKELFIVAQEDKLLGYAHVGKHKGTWELFRIYVLPSQKRKGIGSVLLRAIERFLRKKKIVKYVAYPHAKNPVACVFYEKKGFVHNKALDRGKTDICYQKRV